MQVNNNKPAFGAKIIEFNRADIRQIAGPSRRALNKLITAGMELQQGGDCFIHSAGTALIPDANYVAINPFSGKCGLVRSSLKEEKEAKFMDMFKKMMGQTPFTVVDIPTAPENRRAIEQAKNKMISNVIFGK